jgi:hypothetical protein
MSTEERNPALCIRCEPEWRRWVRQRSRELGLNESSFIELACSWFADQVEFREDSPAIWHPEINPRITQKRCIDTALYLNVTADWKDWIGRLAQSQRISVSSTIEQALMDYANAQGVSLPPDRTRHFTHRIR